MEPIKITDKLTLRQEALRMALQTVYGVNVSENLKDLVIKRAEDIAEYLKGSADLPERHTYVSDGVPIHYTCHRGVSCVSGESEYVRTTAPIKVISNTYKEKIEL